MRKSVSLVAAVAIAALAVSGCARGGINRARPDEFAVARQAPLVIPPDFALVPPQPGAAGTQQTANAQAETLEALFGGPARRSASENAAIDQAGANADDPGIRSSVGDPGTTVVDKGSTTRDIVAAPQGDGQDARAKAGQ